MALPLGSIGSIGLVAPCHQSFGPMAEIRASRLLRGSDDGGPRARVCNRMETTQPSEEAEASMFRSINRRRILINYIHICTPGHPGSGPE